MEQQQQQAEIISKRKQKKMAKREKQKERDKEKKILRKQIKKEKQKQLEQSNQPQTNEQISRHIKKDREQYKEEMKNGVIVIIDLQFMNQMTLPEKTSLYKQIELCHSMNYRSEKPLQLIVTSLTEDFKTLLAKSNASNWGICLEEKPYLDLYPLEKLIYLTGDTDEILQEIKHDEIYIIGGLVDHNRLKQITYKRALEQGIVTKKIPINIDLKTSSILTVNQVFEILLRCNNGATWDDAVSTAIPKRKLK